MPHNFTDEEIVRLFGHEDAEREEPARLREYFLKNDVYTRVRANLPLRVLIGYKGVGKSALFKICEIEDKSNEIASIWIKPDDIAHLSSGQNDLNVMIREWKIGIQDIIFRKVAEEFGHLPQDSEKGLVSYGHGLLQSLITLANNRIGQNIDPAKKAFIRGFLKKKRVVIYLDDLDRDWKGNTADTIKIAALLNAVRDIIADTKDIHFRIALRSDVFKSLTRNECKVFKDLRGGVR